MKHCLVRIFVSLVSPDSPTLLRILAGCSLLVCCGCRFQLPALKPPNFDPKSASAAAMEHYDANGDGTIEGDELENAPGISFALDRIDADDNQSVTADEISTMIQEKWIGPGDGVIRVKVVVMMGRREVEGATVTFEPEPFLSDVLHPATGVTDIQGFAAMTVSEEHMQHPNARGVAPGLYLVRISKMEDGEEKIPAKYNSQTTLGVEVASRASYMPGHVEFRLRK